MELGPILRAMRRNKIRFGLIVMEVALTLAIVANCVAMIRDARAQMTHASGFDDANLVSVRSTPFEKAFKEEGYLDNALAQDLQSLRALPGVRNASNTRFLPWQGGGSSTEMRPAGSKGERRRTEIYNGDEATLDALGVPLSEGRNFTREEVERDTVRLRTLTASKREMGADGLPREKFLQDVLISRAFGRLAFGDAPLLGKMLEDSDGDLYRVVGVFNDLYNAYGLPIHEHGVGVAHYSH